MNRGYCEDCGCLEGGENGLDWLCGESGKKVEDMDCCPNMAYSDYSMIYFDLYWEDLNEEAQKQILQAVGENHNLDNGSVLMTLIF